MATADEEAGGSLWRGMVGEKPAELFSTLAELNEGGSGRRFAQDVAVMVEVTQKGAAAG